ncbi:hypothetical protein D3C76_165550 [compost metagenome]
MSNPNRVPIATFMTLDGHTIILIGVRQLVGMALKYEIHLDGLKVNTVEFDTEAEAKKAFADVVMQWAIEG